MTISLLLETDLVPIFGFVKPIETFPNCHIQFEFDLLHGAISKKLMETILKLFFTQIYHLFGLPMPITALFEFFNVILHLALFDAKPFDLKMKFENLSFESFIILA